MAGDVRVSKAGHLLGRLHRGDCFGEMAYIGRRVRTATVTADGPLTLLKINANLVEQLSPDCQIRFYRVFLQTLVERLSRTTELAVQVLPGAAPVNIV